MNGDVLNIFGLDEEIINFLPNKLCYNVVFVHKRLSLFSYLFKALCPNRSLKQSFVLFCSFLMRSFWPIFPPYKPNNIPHIPEHGLVEPEFLEFNPPSRVPRQALWC